MSMLLILLTMLIMISLTVVACDGDDTDDDASESAGTIVGETAGAAAGEASGEALLTSYLNLISARSPVPT